MSDATLEKPTMGRVLVDARIENYGDLWAVEQGLKPPDAARAVDVTDALVDTGCTVLGLPKTLIDQLGLTLVQTRPMRTATGIAEAKLYGAVRLTVQDRFCLTEVMEVPDHCPVLIGQIPLEILDFVVSPKEQKLIGNPEHGGEQMYELFSIL